MNLDGSIDSVCRDLAEYSKGLDAESFKYWGDHQERFRYLAHLVDELVGGASAAGMPIERILDIGNSYQTVIVDRTWPHLQIDTLGFLDTRFAPNGKSKHFSYDLNDAYFLEQPSSSGPEHPVAMEDSEKYDLILFLEVIEHLYTAPEIVLNFLSTLLRPGGHIVIQTPNATSLIKRLRLLFGENPYELIRKERLNPGHFREYTKSEIENIAQQSDYLVRELRMTNYFPTVTTAERFCDAVSYLLPATFKTGMTIVLQKK